MKTLTYSFLIFFLLACTSHHLKTVNEQMDACKEGYLMALKSDIPDLTEDVIFQIILKRMNGIWDNSEDIKEVLYRLTIEGQNESIREKALLALSYLACKDEACRTEIKAGYHDPDKMFTLLKTYLNNNYNLRYSSE